MLRRGDRVDEPWADGSTALLGAVNNLAIDIAEMLIAHGADVNGVTEGDYTPLMALGGVFGAGGMDRNCESHKARAGQMFDLLIAAGADIERRDESGWRAVDFAERTASPLLERFRAARGAAKAEASDPGETTDSLPDQPRSEVIARHVRGCIQAARGGHSPGNILSAKDREEFVSELRVLATKLGPEFKDDLLIALDPKQSIRHQAAVEPGTHGDILSYLAFDRTAGIRSCVAFNDGTPKETLQMLLSDPDEYVRINAGTNLDQRSGNAKLSPKHRI